MDSILNDLRYTLRTLRKAPAFALAAVLTLALGIGVNTAVFTVFRAALLEKLPVAEPERLVQVYTWTSEGGDHFDFSYPLYVDLRDHNEGFTGLAAYDSGAVGLTARDRAERVIAEFVSSNYFQVLGVTLARGSGFGGADELAGGPAHAVISHRLWQSIFDGDPSIVGKSLAANGRAFTIVGVAPKDFDGVVRGQRADLWMTLPQARPNLMGRRSTSWLILTGRLKPGISPVQASDQLTGVVRQMPAAEGAATWQVRTRPAGAGDTGLVESLSSPLLLLSLAVGIILVIAAANVANLLLARSYARQSEIALRQALGASRGRIVRQILTEGLVLAAAGGGAGLLLAGWLNALFEVRTPGGGTALALRLEADFTVAAFTAALSLVAALGAGLLPAITASRPDLLLAIKGASDRLQAYIGKRRLRSALVVVQIALAVVLIVGAGLFLRSLAKVRAIDPSIANEHVLAATLNLTLRGYDEARGRQFYADVVDRVRRVPGVQAAGLAYVLPVTAGAMRMNVNPRSTVPAVDSPVEVELIPVSDGFFQTMGIPLLRGRDFGRADRTGAPLVIIINETMKQRFWPSGDAIGQRFTIADTTYEVAGLARDTKYRNLREQPRMTMYVPLDQSYMSSANVIVRSALPTSEIASALREGVHAVDSGMPLYNVRTMAEHVGRSLYLDRARAQLVSWLATLALALAAIGIYGVVSYMVSERTREVGIRLALGANPRTVLHMVLGAGARLAAGGLAVGLLLALWLTRYIASELYAITRTDPVTLAGSCALLAVVVLTATLIPAWRATQVDPIVALRHE